VNQYQNFVNPNGTIKTALLPDGVHPNQTGYELMAGAWSAAIQSLRCRFKFCYSGL
jgi:lysophospholipase L1-like esterase